MAMTLDGTSGITQLTGSIVMSGSTSGTVTIIPTATAGSNTATLPAATGTMMVSGNMPAFSAYLGANQNISNNTLTKIQINTEEFDTNNYFDNSTNYRFTPLIAGYYLIEGKLENSASTSPTRAFVTIYKNGSEYKRGVDILVPTTTGVQAVNISALVYLNGSTDYIELYGYISANTPVISGASAGGQGVFSTYFQGILIRGA